LNEVNLLHGFMSSKMYLDTSHEHVIRGHVQSMTRTSYSEHHQVWQSCSENGIPVQKMTQFLITLKVKHVCSKYDINLVSMTSMFQVSKIMASVPKVWHQNKLIDWLNRLINWLIALQVLCTINFWDVTSMFNVTAQKLLFNF